MSRPKAWETTGNVLRAEHIELYWRKSLEKVHSFCIAKSKGSAMQKHMVELVLDGINAEYILLTVSNTYFKR